MKQEEDVMDLNFVKVVLNEATESGVWGSLFGVVVIILLFLTDFL